MTLDLVSIAIGFVPGALAAGAYAFTHNGKLTQLATDAQAIKAGISTVSTTAANAVNSVVNAAKQV